MTDQSSETPQWDAEQDASVAASVEHADEAYKLENTPDGKFEDVKEDIDDRIALAATPHTEVSNDESHDSKDLIQVEVGPDDDGDGASEKYPQEILVKELAESGQLYEKGGPLPSGELSDGADGLFLAERSKQTGEKLF